MNHSEDVPAVEDQSLTSRTPSRRKFLGALAVGVTVAGVPGVALAQQGRNRQRGARQASATPQASPSPVAARVSPGTDATTRRANALAIRHQAADLAAAMPLPTHLANGEERADLGYALSFTKGLPHDYGTGTVERTADFEQFVRATESGQPADFIATPLGPRNGFRTAPNDSPVRAWESQGIGAAYDLVGPDTQAVTMPPAPTVDSHEQAAEMAEVYAQAILRDTPLAELRAGGNPNDDQQRQVDALSRLAWFDQTANVGSLSQASSTRRRTNLSTSTAFRGIAPGDLVGPYLSQLMLAGTAGPGGRTPADGLINFGAQTINQRVQKVDTEDFMTSWDEWFDVQNGLVPSTRESFDGTQRFITTGRDLATYVHGDALYQPYLNAALVLFGQRTPLDPGMPFQGPDSDDHQQGFVLFGGPHVLAMLTEVCMCALKAVKYQKFNVHRRHRPEALAARIEKADVLQIPELNSLVATLSENPIASGIQAMNAQSSGSSSMLLPMAFAEGSPMHPSYGAGHGTVAGACATILKALFNHNHPITVAGGPGQAFVANSDGSALDVVDVLDAEGRPAEMTVEGEVNKLAANISIGRDWAGVHYFSDYWESMLLGEAIAIQILRENMLTSQVDYSLTVPTFAGDSVSITS